jgi:hypothetical protein
MEKLVNKSAAMYLNPRGQTPLGIFQNILDPFPIFSKTQNCKGFLTQCASMETQY